MNNFALITLNITLVLLLHVLLHVFSRSSYIQQPHTYATLLHNLIFMKLLDSLSLSFSLVAKVFPSYLLSIFDFLRTFSCLTSFFPSSSTLVISLFLSNFSISGPKNPWGFQSNLLYISVFSLLFLLLSKKNLIFSVFQFSLWPIPVKVARLKIK